MNKLNFNFIKGCKDEGKLSPEWLNAFETIMPKWLELYVPAYEVCNRHGASIFDVANHIDNWSDAEKFVEDGFAYILWHRDSGITEMAFDAEGDGYGAHEWEQLISCEYPNLYKNYTPDWHRTSVELGDFGIYHWYFTRVTNIKEPYDYVANRVRDYFRLLTNDPDVLFSLGCRSYIALDDKGKHYAKYYRNDRNG